jgi:hypothetical protein
MRSLDLRGRMRSLGGNLPSRKDTTVTFIGHNISGKTPDRRGMRAALSPFCQNGICSMLPGCFATTDWSAFRQKIGSFGFYQQRKGRDMRSKGVTTQHLPSPGVTSNRRSWVTGGSEARTSASGPGGSGLGRWIWMSRYYPVTWVRLGRSAQHLHPVHRSGASCARPIRSRPGLRPY